MDIFGLYNSLYLNGLLYLKFECIRRKLFLWSLLISVANTLFKIKQLTSLNHYKALLELFLLLDFTEQESHIYSIECCSTDLMALESDQLSMPVLRDSGFGEHHLKVNHLMENPSILLSLIHKVLVQSMKIALMILRFSPLLS